MMTLYAGIAFLSVALAVVAYTLARTPAEPPQLLGLRGYKRQRALAAGGGFALLDPVIRAVAGWMARVPARNARLRSAQLLSRAGDYLGLGPNEYMALIAIGGVLGLAVGALVVVALDAPVPLAAFTAAFGAWTPYSLVVGEAQRRRCSIERELPATIELMAMCMSAGMDFPGSIEQVTADRGLDESPLCEELRRIRRELELGHARRRALEAFALRVPGDAVRDFVAAVVQSEAKGTPLRDVLRIQARVLRTRRSILAEEAAARASVQMIGPLVMLLSATLLLIAGPLFLRTMSGGL